MPKPVKTCPECGERFTQAHHRKLFCSTPHQIAFNKRREKRGHRLATLALAWRAGRSMGRAKTPEAQELKEAAQDAFGHMCRLLDEFAAEDRAAGRMHPTKVFNQLQRYNMLDW